MPEHPLYGLIKIIEYGHSKLTRETQIRALLISDTDKLEKCLKYYEALEEFEICDTLKAALEVKQFNSQFASHKKKLDC